MEKIQLDVIKPWVTKRITDMLGFEDDVVLEFIFNMLESAKVFSNLYFFIKFMYLYNSQRLYFRRIQV